MQDQDSQFIGLTVGEDVAFSLENDCVEQKKMKAVVMDSLQKVQMHTFHSRSPHELSGGQKQTVSLAGLLTTDADILLFYEPLANLDPISSLKTVELIQNVHQQLNKTIVIIEHRIEEILKLDLDKIILIDDGEIVAIDSPKRILQTNMLQEIGLREPVYIEALKNIKMNILDEELYPIGSLNHERLNKAVKQWMLNSTTCKKQQKKEILCKIENISFSYSHNGFTLRDITLSIQRGEIVALLGHNGAGKSTLAHLLTGMNKAQKGKIVLDNDNITSWSIRKRGEVISYVMQNPNHMIIQSTVWDEVAFSLKLQKASSSEIHKRVEDALQICGLYPFRNWPIQALSYGQKKRLTIASVLTMNPKLIILDEPTAGQDYFHYKQFMSCINVLATQGISFIFITHDMNLALEYTDRAVVLHQGRILADDTVPIILANSEVLQQANLQESSLTTLAKLSKVPFPEVFVQMYMEKKRRGDYE